MVDGSREHMDLGLQNLMVSENNNFGKKVVDVAQQVSSSGNGNNFRIGASADYSNNGFGSKTVRLGQGLNSWGDGNSFEIGL